MSGSGSAITAYLNEVEKHLSEGRATEHTYRPTLEALLKAFLTDADITNEPKQVACGAPDFVIAEGRVTLGHVETKDIGADLDGVESTEQLKRYRAALPNLVLTDYLEFRLYREGERAMSCRLGRETVGGAVRREPGATKEFEKLIEAFKAAKATISGTPKDLAEKMAALARIIRDSIERALGDKADRQGPLHSQLEAFRETLITGLKPEQFADMYAQTIAYGLFAARCNHSSERGPFGRETAVFDLPETNPFLRKIFNNIAGVDIDLRIAWAVDHLAELLARADLAEILKDFGRRTRREDPVVHFYETFLKAYDPAQRERRGVYYTPEPVVQYIVNSVDAILKRDFGIADGLASAETITHAKPIGDAGGLAEREDGHRVLILDPAAGTGTFLHAVVDLIHARILASGKAGMWDGYVAEHLLPRLFGFELLMAPYTIAHMKLGLQLADLKYSFKPGQRLRLYLTNTLDEAKGRMTKYLLADAIVDEANSANEVKATAPVMVIIGNPPYSGHSANKSPWINNLMRGDDGEAKTHNYFEVDGAPLGERNPKWLNDDYVKFIRFAQWRIERTGYGVLAFVTNHGYLDNPTFRGMRQSLMRAFDEIYLLDLHGNVKKKEQAPDGGKDENVFDIQQGVAIGIFVKRSVGDAERSAAVRHAELWGAREERDVEGGLRGGKYLTLQESDVTTTRWREIEPRSPFYLFTPRAGDLADEYEKGWKINDIMPVNSVGIVTARDGLTIGWDRGAVFKTVMEFAALGPEGARLRFRLGNDVQDWKVSLAQEDIRSAGPSEEHLARISYRPFDTRWTYYTGKSRGFICRPRTEVMRHMLAGVNVGICTCRQVNLGTWSHVFLSSTITDDSFISNRTRERGYLLPLYTYPKLPNARKCDQTENRSTNLSVEFIKAAEEKTGFRFIKGGDGDLESTLGPEDVFHYIYAVFHSPGYRRRYAEFLRTDFPRVPLTGNVELFRELCKLGSRLTDLHLLRDEGLGATVGYPEAGDHLVERVRYDETRERVYINKTQYFSGAPRSAWEMTIGGYRVCEKWLKDRKGRRLTYDELGHYQKVVSALAETASLMKDVDTAIEARGGWPLN